MYRVYHLTDKEKGKIIARRWDGDCEYFDVFENEQERDAEELRLKKIEKECKAQKEQYLNSLKGE